MTESKLRRFDLDWLRVIVFTILIFYHVGMFFVPWDWHIKNNEVSESFRWPMLFVNQWRLSSLFLISGMGTCFALSHRTVRLYLRERLHRLFLPLIFGMLIIVPPQVYVERLVNLQINSSYFQYFPMHAFTGIYPEGNLSWHHLWFLPYLLIFSIVLTPLFIKLRSNPESVFLNKQRQFLKNPYFLFVYAIPFHCSLSRRSLNHFFQLLML